MKALAGVIAFVVVISLLALVLYLGLALVRMIGITALQWRDLVSIDRWQEVFSTIGRNKLRTFLTTLSVAWGIFVLVLLLGLGRGLQQGAQKSFARDAMNGVWINASRTSLPYGGYDIGRILQFENSDYEFAKKVPGIQFVSAQHWIRGSRWGSQMTRFGSKAQNFSLEAVHPNTIRIQAHDMMEGRFLNDGDILSNAKSAVVGKTAAQFLFEGQSGIGEWITVAGVAFQVVGVFSDAKGAEDERRVYIPATTAQLAFNGGNKLGQLQLMIDGGAEQAQKAIDTIVAHLAQKYDFDPKDRQAVRVHNNIENAAKFTTIFWLISTFVVVIGLGTLAAGVVGVSNIMMIAVKERTKEIGVRKALGATPRSIIFLIIQEAIFLTGFAGLLGLTAGVGVLELMSRVVENEMLYNPSIDFSTGVAATVFLVTAGALAGYFPARAAAKVNPITALRDA